MLIGVHVRRTDYARFLRKSDLGRAFDDNAFYVKAMVQAISWDKLRPEGYIFLNRWDCDHLEKRGRRCINMLLI